MMRTTDGGLLREMVKELAEDIRLAIESGLIVLTVDFGRIHNMGSICAVFILEIRHKWGDTEPGKNLHVTKECNLHIQPCAGMDIQFNGVPTHKVRNTVLNSETGKILVHLDSNIGSRTEEDMLDLGALYRKCGWTVCASNPE